MSAALWWFLIDTATGMPVERRNSEAELTSPVPAGLVKAHVQAVVGPWSWNPITQSITQPVQAEAVPHLTIVQFRKRWTLTEQIRYEARMLDSAVLRMIRANILDRASSGVDPTSDLMSQMLDLVIQDSAGLPVEQQVLVADRKPALQAPVGTYSGETGYTMTFSATVVP